MEQALKLVYQDEDMKLYQFEPKFFRLFKYNLQNHSLVTRIRYMLDYLQEGKYVIYYLFSKEELIGECVITPGGRRLKCANKKDVVIGGPYYIIPEQRGKGFSEILIKLSLQYCKYDWENAYDYIKKDNLPSIKTTIKCGFKKVGEINIDTITHVMRAAENGGRFSVYCLKHKDLIIEGEA